MFPGDQCHGLVRNHVLHSQDFNHRNVRKEIHHGQRQAIIEAEGFARNVRPRIDHRPSKDNLQCGNIICVMSFM